MTKQLIEVQKRMEDLIQGADAVATKVSAVGAGEIPSFSEFMAMRVGGDGGGGGDGQISSPSISHRD